MAVKKIINLHASWCNPCKAFESTFNRVASNEKYKDITFERIDIESDEGIKLTEEFHVKSIPTTILLDENNQVLMKAMGAIPENDFHTLIDNHI